MLRVLPYILCILCPITVRTHNLSLLGETLYAENSFLYTDEKIIVWINSGNNRFAA